MSFLSVIPCLFCLKYMFTCRPARCMCLYKLVTRPKCGGEGLYLEIFSCSRSDVALGLLDVICIQLNSVYYIVTEIWFVNNSYSHQLSCFPDLQGCGMFVTCFVEMSDFCRKGILELSQGDLSPLATCL